MNVQEFAETLLAQQRQRIARDHSQWQADAETVAVRPGPVYVRRTQEGGQRRHDH